jgi:hypothetical protein
MKCLICDMVFVFLIIIIAANCRHISLPKDASVLDRVLNDDRDYVEATDIAAH